MSKTADQVVRSGGARLWLYSPPFLAWAVTPAIGGILYAGTTAGREPAMGVASVLTLATAGLPAFTWHAYAERKRSIQIHATATAGGLVLLVDAMAAFGLANWPVWLGWGAAGIGALTWGIRRIAQPAQANTNTEPSAFEKAVGGAKLGKPKVIEGQVTARITANRGEETIKDVQARANNIGSALGIRPNGVRVIPDPDDAGAGTITIVPVDPLKHSPDWPGPSHPGTSIADYPIPFGTFEDGTVGQVWLCGDDDTGRNLVHWLIMGMNGAGKSDGWCNIIADALTRCDVQVWGSDHVKEGQTFGPLATFMHRVASTIPEGKKLIADANAERARRQRAFANSNPIRKQWGKGCGFPLLIVWLEEAADLVEDSAKFTKLVKECRSAGIVILVSLQLAKHDQLDTTARSQLAGASCFGLRDSADAGFALPDDVIDAGAAPENWGNRFPGYSYWVADGIPAEKWSMPARTFRHRAEQCAAHLDKHLTPTAATPATPPVPAGSGVDSTDDYDDDEDMVPMLREMDPDLVVDPTAPVGPPPVDMPFDVPAAPKRTTAEARAVVQQHLRALIAEGRTHTQAADLSKMKPETGFGREWIRKEMIRLANDDPKPGDVWLKRDEEDPPGVWEIVAPALVGV